MEPRWSFLSNYGQVVLSLARQPDLRLREIAEIVGITPRATQTIVSDLVETGFIERSRGGRRNKYQIRGDRALPDAGAADHDVSDLVGALVSTPGLTRRRSGSRCAIVLGCSDHLVQEPLRDLLAAEGLLARADVILWPGGAAALTGPEGKLLLEVLASHGSTARPTRVLLVAHDGCSAWTAFDRPGDDLFRNMRDIRRRRARTIASVAAMLRVAPESWYLTASGAHRVGVSRGESSAAGDQSSSAPREDFMTEVGA